MLSFWFLTKLSHLLPLDVMLTKSVNIKSSANRHGRISCFCSISLCSNYQFDLFVHADPYSPLNYPHIMFQEPPDTRRKTIADVLWNNCWPDGQNDDWGSKVVLLLKNPLHSWRLWLEPSSPSTAGTGQPAASGFPAPLDMADLRTASLLGSSYIPGMVVLAGQSCGLLCSHQLLAGPVWTQIRVTSATKKHRLLMQQPPSSPLSALVCTAEDIAL